ncbi:MAG: RnfABCDGE type electron transport complex subunit D [Nitrospiraceae bacterium]|nr:RnfABCDGE type electron transport complex subunit D [Nitrospiraceae bacterium]
MGYADEKTETGKLSYWQDPRLYQIASLSTLLTYGLFRLDFGLSTWQIVITISTALLTQYAGTRFAGLPRFDPKSALISSLSLCLLLRTNDPVAAVLASLIAIGSKFLFRWHDKHIFNPTNLALTVLLASGLGWISPGQWGQVAWFGFLIACLGSLVVTRAARADVTISFLGFYIGLLIARTVWLGDPLTIPLHQIQSGALLIFAFFMISDPKTTPDSRAGRILYALCVALVALYVQFGFFRPNGPLWGLVFCAPLVPVIDRWLPGIRYAWKAPSIGHVPSTPALSLPVPLSISQPRRIS